MNEHTVDGLRIPWNSPQVCAVDDFIVGEGVPVAPTQLTARDTVPYAVDWQGRRVCWVRLGDVRAAHAEPFLYMGLRRHARAVLLTSFEQTLQALAGSRPDGSRIALLFSTGRCGSTLMTSLIQTSAQCATFSEPDWTTTLRRADITDEALALIPLLLEAHVRAIEPAPRLSVFKLRGIVTDVITDVTRAVPGAHPLFMYRELEATVRSLLARPAPMPPEEMWRRLPYHDLKERVTAELRAALVSPWPELAPVFAVLRAAQAARTLPIKTISYDDLIADPSTTMARFFAAFGVPPVEAGVLRAALATDSQAGTPLSSRDRSRGQLRDGYYASILSCFPELPEALGELRQRHL